ncbi:hypothetical protein TVAG_447930 [Trichomonas vaginalis G3]|uniref:Uncharacterized protein n=1 Tax=Trichomonas vaginalis (strain ATCC PRA-98 / G3) TaxID=412133 RepID=A2DS64_TRIV3|nr:spectrin binding [Trichomonas vaginalis G3]EAY16834.1 hypothetical protein TVAG_447930 [Trichomonas vaginalis G3]KAI5490754.1 spectrin binding [Trichomonas vaginalis G3]|eukprot:XP_001329057.1 hypothetical protein [Trichomonas vaginalis G3]
MAQDMNLNYEYIAAHISDYIKNENFFDTFDVEDIKKIMKCSRLTVDQYITLLKQSHTTINSKELYTCTRKAHVTIQNMEEIVSILKSIKKYMKFKIFDDMIDILDRKEKDTLDSRAEIQKHQEKLKEIQEQRQSTAKETEVNRTHENNNFSREFLTKIAKLKKSRDFEQVYQFFWELSIKGNQEMIQKACEEGLWEKITWKDENVLHVACVNGNLNLVKLLIDCKCNKEVKDIYKQTPLFFASSRGHLEVVKYLVSVGADKEAKNNDEWTPLIIASENGHLEVVKYLISVGADKEAKDNDEWTPLIWASKNGHHEVVKYLISVGADKEAKNDNGFTPLILASRYGHLEVVKYLISVGADKEAKNKEGKTALNVAKGDVRKYLTKNGAK